MSLNPRRVPASRGGPAYLPSAVAALPSQVLPMDQRASGPAALQGKPRVNERGGAGIVVNKESLEKKKAEGIDSQHFLFFNMPEVNVYSGLRFHSPM